MTRAAELARKAGWQRWHESTWQPLYGVVGLRPEKVTDHALALADFRWPRSEGWTHCIYASERNGWSFYAMREYDDCEEMLGDTLCAAICAALDAAGEKDG